MKLNGSVKLMCFSFLLDGPAVIYRDDLSSDYVAYWLVEFYSSQFVVTSSGPNTGMFVYSMTYLTDEIFLHKIQKYLLEDVITISIPVAIRTRCMQTFN